MISVATIHKFLAHWTLILVENANYCTGEHKYEIFLSSFDVQVTVLRDKFL